MKDSSQDDNKHEDSKYIICPLSTVLNPNHLSRAMRTIFCHDQIQHGASVIDLVEQMVFNQDAEMVVQVDQVVSDMNEHGTVAPTSTGQQDGVITPPTALQAFNVKAFQGRGRTRARGTRAWLRRSRCLGT